MLRITPRLALDDRSIEFRFIRASGPGGQNVNKVATAAELRFDLAGDVVLPEPVKQRLHLLAGKRISREGVLVISAQRFRTQERNRADALERLQELVKRAAQSPRKRIPTKPTKASKRRRLDGKRQLADKKRLRRNTRDE